MIARYSFCVYCWNSFEKDFPSSVAWFSWGTVCTERQNKMLGSFSLFSCCQNKWVASLASSKDDITGEASLPFFFFLSVNMRSWLSACGGHLQWAGGPAALCPDAVAIFSGQVVLQPFALMRWPLYSLLSKAGPDSPWLFPAPALSLVPLNGKWYWDAMIQADETFER